MKILTDDNNVIVEIAEEIIQREDRYYIPSKNSEWFMNYPIQDAEGNIENHPILLYSVNLPNNVEERKYCYTENDGFYENPDYVEPPKPTEERLDIAEDSITEIELALTEIYEGGLV